MAGMNEAIPARSTPPAEPIPYRPWQGAVGDDHYRWQPGGFSPRSRRWGHQSPHSSRRCSPWPKFTGRWRPPLGCLGSAPLLAPPGRWSAFRNTLRWIALSIEFVKKFKLSA